MIDVIKILPEASIDTVLIEKLKENQTVELKQVV